MASSVVELERLVVRLTGDATDYLDMLSKAEKSTAEFADRIQSQINAVSLAVATPLVGIGGAGVKAFADFDQGMKKAMAIMKPTDEQIKSMRDTVLDLSGKTIQGPTELSNSFYTLASAGYQASQAVSVLPAMAEFATASGMELAKATYLVTTAQGALGLRSKDTAENLTNLTRVMDVLSKANTLADATIEYFATALSTQAGVTLRAFNKDVEEGAAVLAVYTRQGIPAQVAGTSYSRVLRLLSKASRENAVQQEALGFAAFDSAGKMKPMWEIIGDLEKILKPMSPQMRSATLAVMGFNDRIQQAIFPLLGASEEMKEYYTQLKMAGGTTKDISDTILGSFTNQMTMLGNTLKVVGVEIGEILAPALTLIGEGTAYLLGLFRSLDPNTKLLIVSIAAITVGLLSFAVAALSAAKVLAFFFAGLGGVIFGGIVVTILAIAGSMGTLVAKFGTAKEVFTAIRKALADFWEFLAPVRVGIVLVFGVIRSVLEDIGTAVSVFANRIKTALQDAALLADTSPLWEQLRDVAVSALYYIALSIRILGSIAKSGLNTLGESIVFLIYNFDTVSSAVIGWVRYLIISNSFVITLVATIIAAIIAFKVLAFALGTLGITQLIWNGLVFVSTALQWAWTTAIAVGNGAVWLFNAALTAMNILMTPLGLVIAIVAAVIAVPLVFALIAAASAAYALVGALQGAWVGILALGDSGGVVQYILDIFSQWGEILRDVANTARTDMPRAFVMLRLAAELAINQVKDLWPPLWQFIQSGTSAIWSYITTQFEILFKQAFYNIYGFILAKGDELMFKLIKTAIAPLKALADAVTSALSGKGRKAAGFLEDALVDLASFRVAHEKNLKTLNKDSEKASEDAAALLKKRLEDAAEGFDVPASEATRRAQEALDYLREGFVGPMPEVKVDTKLTPPDVPDLSKWLKRLEEWGEEGGGVLNKGVGKEIQRFDAALSRSAESITRLEEYRSKIADTDSVFKGKIGIQLPKRFDATAVGGAEGKTRDEEMLEQLKKINEAIRLGLKKPGLPVAPADL